MKKRFLFEEENVGAIYTTNPGYIKEKEKYERLNKRNDYTIALSLCHSVLAIFYAFFTTLVLEYNLDQLIILNIVICSMTLLFLVIVIIQTNKLQTLDYKRKFRTTLEYKKQVDIMQMTDKEKVELIFDVVDKTKRIKGKRQDKIDAVLKIINKK